MHNNHFEFCSTSPSPKPDKQQSRISWVKILEYILTASSKILESYCIIRYCTVCFLCTGIVLLVPSLYSQYQQAVSTAVFLLRQFFCSDRHDQHVSMSKYSPACVNAVVVMSTRGARIRSLRSMRRRCRSDRLFQRIPSPENHLNPRLDERGLFAFLFLKR